MHPFSVLTLGIFVAGYITARWDLVTRLYELAIFAWDHGVVVSLFASLISFFPWGGRQNFERKMNIQREAPQVLKLKKL